MKITNNTDAATGVTIPPSVDTLPAGNNISNGIDTKSEFIKAQLDRAQDTTKLNPHILPITAHARQRAEEYIKFTAEWRATNCRQQSDCLQDPVPFIVVAGDGGVIVEWKFFAGNRTGSAGNRPLNAFISLNFDGQNTKMDVIFSNLSDARAGGGEERSPILLRNISYDFEEETLQHLFAHLYRYLPEQSGTNQ